jgi:hypothetical protein
MGHVRVCVFATFTTINSKANAYQNRPLPDIPGKEIEEVGEVLRDITTPYIRRTGNKLELFFCDCADPIALSGFLKEIARRKRGEGEGLPNKVVSHQQITHILSAQQQIFDQDLPSQIRTSFFSPKTGIWDSQWSTPTPCFPTSPSPQ